MGPNKVNERREVPILEIGLEVRGVSNCENPLSGDVKTEGSASTMPDFCSPRPGDASIGFVPKRSAWFCTVPYEIPRLPARGSHLSPVSSAAICS
jgi:hypothetical protein